MPVAVVTVTGVLALRHRAVVEKLTVGFETTTSSTYLVRESVQWRQDHLLTHILAPIRPASRHGGVSYMHHVTLVKLIFLSPFPVGILDTSAYCKAPTGDGMTPAESA